MSQERSVYDAYEIAEKLGVALRTVYLYAREGRIPCVRVGDRYLFPKASFDKWLANAGQPQPAKS